MRLITTMLALLLASSGAWAEWVQVDVGNTKATTQGASNDDDNNRRMLQRIQQLEAEHAIRKKEAIEGYEKLKLEAHRGNSNAQFDYANSLRNGHWIGKSLKLDLKQDKDEAFSWMQRAANQNHPLAAYHLSGYFRNGIGTFVDNQKAFSWAKIAADSEVQGAQVDLSEMYELGIGTMPNYAASYFWALLASDHPQPEIKDFGSGLAWSNHTERAKGQMIKVLKLLDKESVINMQNAAYKYRMNKSKSNEMKVDKLL